MAIAKVNFKRRWMRLVAIWWHHERECFGYVPGFTVLDARRWVRRGNSFSCCRGDVMVEAIKNFVLVGLMFSILCVMACMAVKFLVIPIAHFIGEINSRFIDKANKGGDNG